MKLSITQINFIELCLRQKCTKKDDLVIRYCDHDKEYYCNVFSVSDGKRCGPDIGVIDPRELWEPIETLGGAYCVLEITEDHKVQERLREFNLESKLRFIAEWHIGYDFNEVENVLIFRNTDLNCLIRDCSHFAKKVILHDIDASPLVLQPQEIRNDN